LVVRAPLEGVIDKVYAQPNKTVAKEALLMTLDDTPLKSRLDVAQQELEIAKAEYRRSEQASVLDAKAATEMPMLAARIAQREAEVAYIDTLLKRIIIRANHAGIAIIHDAYELEGKPVKLGERLLTIAQPNQAELEMWLAVGDSIDLPDAAEVKLFLNVAPETPYPAVLRYVNFQAEMSPEGLFAFRVRADFPDPQQLPRVGLRGTAKIYGKQVPLYYYVFRRPYAAARQWLGL
jgi:multidrug efflux pump subunit AcrA (membrane-fusion protein)